LTSISVPYIRSSPLSKGHGDGYVTLDRNFSAENLGPQAELAANVDGCFDSNMDMATEVTLSNS